MVDSMIAEAPADLRCRCRNISVRYGDFAALTDVSVAFAPRLIHAVVGQNGAGKTTFARVVAGIVQTRFRNARRSTVAKSPPAMSIESRAAGVELVHQSFALPPSFTVAEAMEFGARRGRPIFTRRELEARWKRHLENLGVQARLARPHSRSAGRGAAGRGDRARACRRRQAPDPRRADRGPVAERRSRRCSIA